MAFKDSHTLLEDILNSLEEQWTENFTFNKNDMRESVLSFVSKENSGWKKIQDKKCKRAKHYYKYGEGKLTFYAILVSYDKINFI